MGKRYDAQINVTLEVADDDAEAELIAEYADGMGAYREDVTIEEALSDLIETEGTTFELGISGVSGFFVAAEKVSYLDG